MRLQRKRDSRPSVHRANFYALISIPKSGRLRTNATVMDVHKWQTQCYLERTCAKRENSIGEPLDVMLDGWMTAFKRVSVPHRQLGANLIDTHKTLASCACGNCRHDSLSLSMKTAGFCKRHTSSFFFFFFQLSSSNGESLHFFCVSICFHVIIFSPGPNSHFTLMSSPFSNMPKRRQVWRVGLRGPIENFNQGNQ